MNRKQRPIIGVICALPSNIEQRELLQGIIKKALELDMDTVVLSNNFNPTETSSVVWCENKIYDLLLSPELDGLILISESIINPDLQQYIKKNLMQMTHLPIVVIGTPLPDFTLPNFHFVNTSDENDLFDLTEHLIKVHGFTKIDMLTGHDYLDASHLRVSGYRKALETNGIPFEESRVHFGNYWMNSGVKMAQKYISGELPYPEAIICGNDHMAYGMLDEFLAHEIPVPERITVVGYEYIQERLYHSPLLSTYHRNRQGAGSEAVMQLYRRMHGEPFTEVPPPKGEMITGESCTCGISKHHMSTELEASRTRKDYDFVNLFSHMDCQLTDARTLTQLIETCQQYFYLVRNVWEIKICLSDNWHTDSEPISDLMTCYSLIWKLPEKHLQEYEFSVLFEETHEPCAYYFNPLFHADRMMGYTVLQYNRPDAYDYIYRSWLKSISTGLVHLRMKNDIRYLLECQNLSESRDTLTGLYNEKGFRKAVHGFEPAKEAHYRLLLLRTGILNSNISASHKKRDIAMIQMIADVVKQLCGSEGICGRIGEQSFAALIRTRSEDDTLPEDLLRKALIQQTEFKNECRIDSYLCGTVPFMKEKGCTASLDEARQMLDVQAKELVRQRQHPYYKQLFAIRENIYQNPAENPAAEDVCHTAGFSVGHFRVLYRECFGVSFHQDCIQARILHAKYLLVRTQLGVTETAQQCGYKEEKYFLRQFRQYTGVTPSAFRGMNG